MKKLQLAAAACALIALSANATTTTLPNYAFTTRTPFGGQNVSTTSNLAKFNSAAGVLTSASMTTLFSGTFTYQAYGTSSGMDSAFSTTGFTSFHSTVSGANVAITNNRIEETISCATSAQCFTSSGSVQPGLAKTVPFAITKVIQIKNDDLNTFVGNNNVTFKSFVGLGTDAHTATNVDSFSARSGLRNAVLTQTLAYTSRAHSQASFESATLSTTASTSLTASDIYKFSVANLGNAGSTGLDSATVSCTGNCDAFDFVSSSFSSLATGLTSTDFGQVSLKANGAAGSYQANYSLNFADQANIGASASRLGSSLLLSVSGDVAAAAVTPVPEPETYALMLAGLGALGFVARRRKLL